jgi:hypothetical protein
MRGMCISGTIWSRKESLWFLRPRGVGDDGLIISFEIISTFIIAITLIYSATKANTECLCLFSEELGLL